MSIFNLQKCITSEYAVTGEMSQGKKNVIRAKKDFAERRDTVAC
jgi:hypothetical protein